MSRVVVLGGAGGIGRVAAKALAVSGEVTEVIVADLREEEAAKVARGIGANVRAAAVDATSAASLDAAIRGATAVLSCVGPFYRFGPPALEAAIRCRVPYVDVCDDLAPTRIMLELDGRAREAGIPALVGMGNSPGLANVFVKLCADSLLDQVKSVDIMHIHGGEPDEGPAVVKHRIFAMTNDVPLFLDGRFVNVRQLEESGRAHTIETEFRGLGKHTVYPYPHPETITLPRYIPGLEHATNLGVIFPSSYFKLTQDMVRVGACSEEPLDVGGAKVVPLEFSVAHVLRERARLLAEAGVTGPAGCLKVVVGGVKDGAAQTFVFSLSSRSAGAGEGTGIPAAVGALLLVRGSITRRGVFPPEAAVQPMETLLTALSLAKKLGAASGDSVHLERIDADGTRTDVPLGV